MTNFRKHIWAWQLKLWAGIVQYERFSLFVHEGILFFARAATVITSVLRNLRFFTTATSTTTSQINDLISWMKKDNRAAPCAQAVCVQVVAFCYWLFYWLRPSHGGEWQKQQVHEFLWIKKDKEKVCDLLRSTRRALFRKKLCRFGGKFGV